MLRPLLALPMLLLAGCAPSLAVDCKVDDDCAPGRCVVGTCVGEGSSVTPDAGPGTGGTGGAGGAAEPGGAVGAIDAAAVAGDAAVVGPDMGCVPTPETCNGLDDNCNGLVDDIAPAPCYDGPPGTQVAPCHGGVTTCQDAHLACSQQVVPTAELCNGVDDDCNGAVDDLPPSDETGDGFPLCTVPHGRGACRAGACAITECEPGFHDVDHLGGNGCERGCAPPVVGAPVGNPPLLSLDSPAIAVLPDGTLAIAASNPNPGDEGRLRVVVGDRGLSLPGEAGRVWQVPSLAARPAGLFLVGRRTPGDNPLGYLGLSAQGAAISEGALPSGPNTGRPVTATLVAGGTEHFIVAATADAEQGRKLSVFCGVPDAAEAPTPAPETILAGIALPTVFAVGENFGVAYMARGAANELHVRMFDVGCRPLDEAVTVLPLSPTGLHAAFGAAPGGLAPRALVAATDATRLVVVPINVADPMHPLADPVQDLPGETLEATPAVVATAAGYWVFYPVGGGDGAHGRPFGFDGVVAGPSVPVVAPGPGLQVGRLRAAPHPQGVAAVWTSTPAGTNGQAGVVTAGILACE